MKEAPFRVRIIYSAVSIFTLAFDQNPLAFAICGSEITKVDPLVKTFFS